MSKKVEKTKGYRQLTVGYEITVDLIDERRMSIEDAEKEWKEIIEKKIKETKEKKEKEK